jgi:hypothetical protein
MALERYIWGGVCSYQSAVCIILFTEAQAILLIANIKLQTFMFSLPTANCQL